VTHGSVVSNFNTLEQRFNIVHGCYDYSESVYVNNSTKLKIGCLTHGLFEQTSNKHLSGNGCPQCFGNKLKTLNEFIRESNLIHNNKYNYSFAEYVNTKTKIKIECFKHGLFEQLPRNHLTGNGCIKCSHESKSYDYVKKYTLNEELGNKLGTFYKLLFKHISGFEFIKIGITSRNIKLRYSGKEYKDFSYTIIEEIKTTNLESALLEKRFKKETKLKKFKFPYDVTFKGKSECYESTESTDAIERSKEKT